MVVLGAGLGMVMQNLTLVVQNDTPVSQLGAASSNVNFFRSIAGTIGVTIMGSVLATQVTSHVKDGLASFTPTSPEEISALQGLAGGGVPHVSELPDAIRVIVEHRREAPVALFSLDGRPHLRLVDVGRTDVSAYQALLTEGA